MRTIHFVILFFLIFFLSEGYPAVKAGKVMEVSGKTDQLRLDRMEKKLPLQVDDALFFKDTVLTGDASTAGLHLTPESDSEVKLFVYENSELKIEPDLLKAGKRHFVAKFNQGLMRFLAKGLKKNNEEFQLNLPNCVVGVRGTEGEVVVVRGAEGVIYHTFISVDEGEVAVTTNVGTTQERIVTVGPGVTATVTGTATSAMITTDVGAPTVADTEMDGSEGDRRAGGDDYFEILKSKPEEIPSVSTQALDMSPRLRSNLGGCTTRFDPTNSREIVECPD